MNHKKWLVGIFASSVLLVGCVGKDKKKNCQQSQSIKTDFAVFKAFHDDDDAAVVRRDFVPHKVTLAKNQTEARLVDVPIPLQSTWLYAGEVNGSITFSTPLQPQELVDFYRQEMERLGWVEQVYFSQAELLLIFKKPNGRWLSVSISRYSSSRFYKRTEHIQVVIQQEPVSAIG